MLIMLMVLQYYMYWDSLKLDRTLIYFICSVMNIYHFLSQSHHVLHISNRLRPCGLTSKLCNGFTQEIVCASKL